MVHYLRSLIVAIVFLLVAVSAYPQDDSSDTSGAQAAIQAIQKSAQTPTLAPPQAYPALKAQYCKEAVAYVEDKDHGLLRRWDDDMQGLKTDRIRAIQSIKHWEYLRDSTYWDIHPIRDVANEVRVACKETKDVLALMTPGGAVLNAAIQISQDFGMKVSQASIRIYELLEKGDSVNEVLHSSTDELVIWALKESVNKRLSAASDLVQAIQEHNKTAQDLADSRSFVQQTAKEIDAQLKAIINDIEAKRDDLLAVEAMKDAVQAACNKGEPTQQAPEFAKGYVVQEPNQSVQPNYGLPQTPSGLPWWATLSTLPLSKRGATATPTARSCSPSDWCCNHPNSKTCP